MDIEKISKPLRLTVAALVILGLAQSARISAVHVRADEGRSCSLATLHGSYGSGTSGWINSSTDPNAITIGTFVPYAEATVFTFDGRGNLSAQAQPDFGGQIPPPATATGTYTVAASTCTGTMSFTTSEGASFHRSLVIERGGDQIDFVSTDAGIVIAGSMHKQ